MKKIILASTSPRRKQILGILGLPFTVVAGTYEEDMTLPMPPKKLARYLALGKANDVAATHQGIIIAADTIVSFGNHVMGKPHTVARAKQMLNKVNGRAVSILTGFAIVDTSTKKTVSRVVESTVWLKKMTTAEINAYIKTGEPLKRAGGFAIQELGAVFVKKISGDFYGAMGLPLFEIARELTKLGVTIF